MKQSSPYHRPCRYLRILCLALSVLCFLPLSSEASVTWGSANAFQWQDSIVVQWTTTSETNNVQFWIEIPSLGLPTPLGPYTSSVTNSTTPTNYEVRFLLPSTTFPLGSYCGFVMPDDGTGWNINNSSPSVCFLNNGPTTLVWPGDANSNGQANVYDLLNIGIANGNTGPARSTVSNTWTGFMGTDWAGQFGSWVNHKFADCDGNGTVNLNDTMAINLNYGLTHSKTSEITAGGIPLTLVYPDSVNASDTVEVEIWLGTATQSVPQAYGIAFSMRYDSSQIKSGSISTNLSSSWLGTPGVDLVHMDHDDQIGQFDIGITRTNGVNASGFGKIGSIGIVLIDNLGKTNFDAKLLLHFIHPLLLDKDGERVDVEVGIALGISQILAPNDASLVQVFPNPASDQISIRVPSLAFGQETLREALVFDMLGKVQTLQLREMGGDYTVDVSTLAPGTYILRMAGFVSHFYKKITIRR